MAGQKARAAQGRPKGGGTATRNGRTAQAAPARNGKNGRADAGGRGQSSNRGPDGRGPGGRPGQGRPAGPQGRAAQVAQPAAPSPADDRFSPPAWVRWTALALSLAGLGVSIYLTIAHYTSTTILACSSKGYVDCAKVTTSAQSMVFGVLPVAVLGLAFYVFMVAVNSPWGWRMRIPQVWWARIGSAVVGIGFVLYLLYAEIIQIGNICLWCTSVHVITFLLFVLLVFTATLSGGATARDAR
ncbi:MAG TPA: vitamin K epoxide reductase family protein [Streptosporangiaceae bacterium]|nr:vitamin K epoxide reductase family protein [Streptosporangiaceae bacterium]